MRKSLRQFRRKQPKCANCNETCYSDGVFFTDQLPDSTLLSVTNPQRESLLKGTIQTEISDEVEIKIETEEDGFGASHGIREDNIDLSVLNPFVTRRQPLTHSRPGHNSKVTVFGALFDVFKVHWKLHKKLLSIAKQDKDLLLCIDCCATLNQLYKWFSKFTKLTLDSKRASFLYPVVHELPKVSTSGSRKEKVNTIIRNEDKQDLNLDEDFATTVTDCKSDHEESSTDVVDETQAVVADGDTHIDDGDVEIPPLKKRKSRQTPKHLWRIRCKVCDIKFPDNWKLRRHVRTKGHLEKVSDFPNEEKINKEDPDFCFEDTKESTPKKGKSPEMRKRKQTKSVKIELKDLKIMKSAEAIPGDCPECGKTFRNKELLSAHVKLHTLVVECAFCEEKFPQKIGYREHLNTVHEEERKEACDTCGKLFFFKADVKFHARTHVGQKDVSCSVCNFMFPSELALKAHQLSHTQDSKLPTFTCPEDSCRKRFTTVKMLQVHIKYIHEKRNDFICPHPGCCKTFGAASYLKYHVVTHGVGTFLCNICGKNYKHKKDLVRHETIVHAPDKEELKKFCCEICSGKYLRADQLRRHMVQKNHFAGGMKPELVAPAPEANPMEVETMELRCRFCGLELVDEIALKRHLFTHDNETEVSRPFTCPDCGKRFQSQHTVESHLKRIHRGQHVCGTCGKRFEKMSRLKKHMFAHSNVQENICEICGKGYKYRKDMEKHYGREHMGEHMYKFQCEACHKKFHRNDMLRTHIIKEHPEYVIS